MIIEIDISNGRRVEKKIVSKSDPRAVARTSETFLNNVHVRQFSLRECTSYERV